MHFSDIKRRLVWLHRWLALALSPLLLLVTLSGFVLAFVPVTEQFSASERTPLDAAALVRVVAAADPDGKATLVSPSADGTEVTLAQGGVWRSYSLADGRLLTETAPPFDFFKTVESLHKNLLIGAGILVEIAAFAMLAIVVLGPLLAWPRLSANLMGWHRAMGWFALPLVVLLPLTATLMVLGIGGPSLPPVAGGPTTPVAALTRAAGEIDLSTLELARSFRQGRVLITLADERTYVASAGGIAPLEGGPGLVRELHEGTWAGAWSGLLNAVGAAALFALTVTGLLSWWRRRRAERRHCADAGATILIAHASHTGTAARLAEATAEALRARGDAVNCAALGSLRPAELAGYAHVLLIASTTGEGDLPEGGRRFLGRLRDSRVDGVRYHLLGLGDRRYRDFCGGARRLDDGLVAAGARHAADPRFADGDAGETWRDWLAGIFPGLDVGEGPVSADRAVRLTLAGRARLTDPTDAELGESWQIVLHADEALDYRPGDLLMIAPEGASPRSYSIGSADPHHLVLTVSLARFHDTEGRERFGLASGLLCRDLALGGRIEAVLHRHDAFRAPADPSRPLIMIGAGCGIAPFVGYIDERRNVPGAGPSWLFFGCRKAGGDFLYRDRLEHDRSIGALSRLSAAFSREGERLHIQDRMRQEAEELRRWLANGAEIRVCGRTDFGTGVEAALIDVLATGGKDHEAARAEIERWRRQGRIAFDLFG